MKTRIEKWYQAQRAGKQFPCPRCGGKWIQHWHTMHLADGIQSMYAISAE